MPYVRSYSLFISHAWAPDDDYNRLIYLLTKIKSFKVEICSKPNYDISINPDSTTGLQKLKGMLDHQIRNGNCAFILPRIFISNKFWIKHTIYFCQNYGVVPILMALPKNEELPAELTIKTKAVIDWTKDSLEKAIKTFSTTRFGAT